MLGRQSEIAILDAYDTTRSFLGCVQEAADQNRTALGFYARSVYERLAREGCLYVAVTADDQGPQYLGHLLFSCHFPRAYVLQLFASPSNRRQGVASRLLDRLRLSLTKDGFTSIYARVAEDLAQSNIFWQRQEFYVQRVEPGGASRNRQIVVRCHELASPQLFPASGISNANPLELPLLASSEVPLFLLDLNVLFDVMPRRLRHEDAARLFRAERMNSCRLAISDEIRRELDRAATLGRTDPMVAYTAIFPTFPLGNEEESRELLDELARIVFPGKELTAQDRSDLAHLATAIQHGLSGLITSDQRILGAAAEIQASHGIRVISPSSFAVPADYGTKDEFDVATEGPLELRRIDRGDDATIRGFLGSLNISGSTVAASWLPTSAGDRLLACMAIWKDSEPVGFLSWALHPGADAIVARAAVDERTTEAPAAGRLLLLQLLKGAVPSAPIRITLDVPAHQSILREVATRLGFATEGGHLSKLVLGRLVLPSTWEVVGTILTAKSGMKLAEDMPEFRHVDQQMQVVTPNGNRVHVPLDVLETLLGPTLFCLPKRPAVITPVQRRYSEALLGHSTQMTFLPHGSAATFHERHYLSSPRTLGAFQRGTLILFYESSKHRGRRAVVAIGRVREAYLESVNQLRKKLEQSVLTDETLTDIGSSEMKTVTAFDSVFHFPNPVSLSKLEKLGCGRATDLLSTKSISDNQLQAILREGFP